MYKSNFKSELTELLVLLNEGLVLLSVRVLSRNNLMYSI